MTDPRKILAIIPARGGSRGVPGKNIKILAGIPLLAHSILHARNSPSVNRIVVSTDDEEIATEPSHIFHAVVFAGCAFTLKLVLAGTLMVFAAKQPVASNTL